MQQFESFYKRFGDRIGHIGVIVAGIVIIAVSLFARTDIFVVFLDYIGVFGALVGVVVSGTGCFMIGKERGWWDRISGNVRRIEGRDTDDGPDQGYQPPTLGQPTHTESQPAPAPAEQPFAPDLSPPQAAPQTELGAQPQQAPPQPVLQAPVQQAPAAPQPAESPQIPRTAAPFPPPPVDAATTSAAPHTQAPGQYRPDAPSPPPQTPQYQEWQPDQQSAPPIQQQGYGAAQPGADDSSSTFPPGFHRAAPPVPPHPGTQGTGYGVAQPNDQAPPSTLTFSPVSKILGVISPVLLISAALPLVPWFIIADWGIELNLVDAVRAMYNNYGYGRQEFAWEIPIASFAIAIIAAIAGALLAIRLFRSTRPALGGYDTNGNIEKLLSANVFASCVALVGIVSVLPTIEFGQRLLRLSRDGFDGVWIGPVLCAPSGSSPRRMACVSDC